MTEVDIVQLEEDYCRRCDIHVCCLYCENPCKQEYSRWSGCMPPTEYCEMHREDELWKYIRRCIAHFETGG